MSEKDNIKHIIKNIFSDKGRLSKGYNQYTIDQVWRETFGEVISSYTSGTKFYNGKLTVYITSSSLKNELSMTKEKVIEKMNKNLKYKKVTELIIR